MGRKRRHEQPTADAGHDAEEAWEDAPSGPGSAAVQAEAAPDPDAYTGPGAEYGYDRPSRSSRKRAAEALQKLGERLTELREPELAALDLPEELLQAVRDARRLGHTPALARARQYIGKLMRRIDTAPIEKALAERAGNWRPRAKLPR